MPWLKGGKVGTLLRVWNIVRGVTGEQLRQMQNANARLAVAGSEVNRSWAIERLGPATESIVEYTTVSAARAAGEALVLNADADPVRLDAGFTAALASLASAHRDIRVALAARYPVFRAIVAEQLSREAAQNNAKLAAISALPGIVPAFDWLMPATAAGDMLVLTRNQITLVLEIAMCYNLAPDPRQRLTELVPVIGGAFGWRALAREAVGLVPGGVGLAVKAAVAYGGTYAAGRAASYYYASGGKQLNIKGVYEASFREAFGRAKAFVQRRRLLPTR